MILLLCILLLITSPLSFAQRTFKTEQDRYARVRDARLNTEARIDTLFKNHEINFPPCKILLAAYKHERLLELWARLENGKAFTLIKQYPFTAFSGVLGPKRKQGDLQIPEGFYYINHFNPFSAFHLSMKISYPNASDRILGVKGNLGNEIRIHGSCVTIGCIPIGDDAIEELYIICVDTKSAGQNNIPVYVFPCRMNTSGMAMLEDVAQANATLLSFWRNLKQGYDLFSRTREELTYGVNTTGQYTFSAVTHNAYTWHTNYTDKNALQTRITLPPGYKRIDVPAGSFAEWLRYIPLKQGSPPVRLYNGAEKSYQDGHHAVVDIDVGHSDLQQCADAIMRLRAEYLYVQHDNDNIVFQMTNGEKVPYRKWIDGYRPIVRNNVVFWHKHAEPDSSYETLRAYLNFVYGYAGSFSMNQELRTVRSLDDMRIGDVFVQGGFPGHAVLVVDMAQHTTTGEKIFLLCQSYMPAQDVHILKNLYDADLDPWYSLEFEETLYTPEWTFKSHDLKRW